MLNCVTQQIQDGKCILRLTRALKTDLDPNAGVARQDEPRWSERSQYILMLAFFRRECISDIIIRLQTLVFFVINFSRSYLWCIYL